MEKRDDWAIEKAPTRAQFEKMLKGVRENMDGEMKLQCEFLLVAIGELGLRGGELTHIRRPDNPHLHDWIDFESNIIEIPDKRHCTCGYCKSQARQAAEQTGIPYEKALEERWKPKTPAAVRTVPFGHKSEVVELFKKFFHVYEDGWPTSRITVNRRVDRIVKESGVDIDVDSVTPQTLRITAAKHHASKRMNPYSLTELMGWGSTETALRYYKSGNNGLNAEMKALNRGSESICEVI